MEESKTRKTKMKQNCMNGIWSRTRAHTHTLAHRIVSIGIFSWNRIFTTYSERNVDATDENLDNNAVHLWFYLRFVPSKNVLVNSRKEFFAIQRCKILCHTVLLWQKNSKPIRKDNSCNTCFTLIITKWTIHFKSVAHPPPAFCEYTYLSLCRTSVHVHISSERMCIALDSIHIHTVSIVNASTRRTVQSAIQI